LIRIFNIFPNVPIFWLQENTTYKKYEKKEFSKVWCKTTLIGARKYWPALLGGARKSYTFLP
jgi:hypothetical protein